MSKLMWEFDLEEDGVEQEFSNAYNGSAWKFVVWDIDKKLRDALKYGHQYKTADEALEDIRKELYDAIDRWGVSFDESMSISPRLRLLRRCSIIKWFRCQFLGLCL